MGLQPTSHMALSPQQPFLHQYFILNLFYLPDLEQACVQQLMPSQTHINTTSALWGISEGVTSGV